MDNITNLVKTQMIAFGAMNTNNNANNNNGMFGMIYGILLMTLMENVLRFVPHIGNFIKKILSTYFERKKTEYIKPLLTKEKEILGSITFEKEYKTISNDDIVNSEIVDALLDYICKQDTARKLLFNERFLISNENIFDITKDIKGRVILIEYSKTNIKSIKFEIFSTTIQLSEIRRWLSDIFYLYKTQQKNNLGDKKYYFNELITALPKDMNGEYRFECANKFINFTMADFNTNKNLGNVFGKIIDNIRERVRLFIDNPGWYEKRGIPYTLGLLLHGPPGTGKTSMIKAIAKDTKRHIINISLRETTTQTQLNNLFYNEILHVLKDGASTPINIPLNQRIYVIEDIDCLTDVVLDRKYKKTIDDNYTTTNNTNEINTANDYIPTNDSNIGSIDPFATNFDNNFDNPPMIDNIDKDIKKEKSTDSSSEKLNLSFILNLLDGVLEVPGRILIMTSNYPERLDKALIRPGRVDLIVKLGKCDTYMIKQFFDHFYAFFQPLLIS